MSEPDKVPVYEDLKARVADYLEPIPGAAPGGINAKFEPAYEAIAKEVGKLDSPIGGAVKWPEVLEGAKELLQRTSKDLLLAAWVANGLYVTKQLDGLVTGTVLLTELFDRYWDTMFPEVSRLRARVNALAWFLDRVNMTLASTAVTAQDRAPLFALGVAMKKLGEVTREKFAGNGPAVGPLVESIERVKLSLPAAAPPPAPPKAAEPAPAATTPPTPAGGTPAATSTASAPTQAASSGPALTEAAPAFDPSGDVITYLRSVGSSLQTVSSHLRRANAADPVAYRLLRTGLWLHLTQTPGGVSSGKTPTPPVAPALRAKLDQMAGNGRFAELLEESESALVRACFCLDLNRYSALALAQLGPSHAAARAAILAELASFLRRLPALLQVTFSDGSPFADPQTKSWLEAEVLPSKGGGGGSGSGGADDPAAKTLEEARTLSGGGKAAEAIALLQASSSSAPSAEARFKLRLALAETAFGAGHSALARAVYVALDKEIETRGLDEWQPAVAVRCLEGYVQCLRTLARASKGLVEPTALAVIYDRLSRLDPSAALRLGAGS